MKPSQGQKSSCWGEGGDSSLRVRQTLLQGCGEQGCGEQGFGAWGPDCTLISTSVSVSSSFGVPTSICSSGKQAFFT